MIKITDYIVKRLEEYGIKHVFMISGGGAMHLNDSFGQSEKIKYICNHHEQASAIAAEGYARIKGGLSVVCVTTGPGGINTLNGVLGQWTDSVPVLYISGQVKTETLKTSYPELNLRQLGDQEADIISLVKPITKFAEQIKNPLDVKRILDEAIHAAVNGRPGPVWIDVPMDIQGAFINEEKFFKFSDCHCEQTPLNDYTKLVLKEIKKAKRPLIVAGNGINISKTREVFLSFLEEVKIPVVTTHNGFDTIASEHPLYIGRIGTIGQRAGNFALQNANLIIFLGTRNNIRQISYDWKNFGKKAKKIVVDIDSAELNKPTLKPDIAINTDLKDFLPATLKQIEDNDVVFPDFSQWVSWCKERKEKYPVVLSEYKNAQNAVNPYYFMETLTKCLSEKSITVTGNGTASVCAFQASVVKKNQRFILNSGCASMGYDLPAAIGACFANEKKDVVCIAGDGSLMMNIQELQTVYHHNLPIKLFILNNNGYISIKQTQNNFFNGRMVASGKESGVSFPDFIKIAEAFSLPTAKINGQNNLIEEIEKVLATQGPVVCEVILQNDYIFQPKHSSEKLPDGKIVSKPLEDMYPFLDRDEFKENMPDYTN
ncbi:MAG: thiamine pyrophosphate-binding protein [bacterium]